MAEGAEAAEFLVRNKGLNAHGLYVDGGLSAV